MKPRLERTVVCGRCGLDFDPVYAGAACPLCGTSVSLPPERGTLPLEVRLAQWAGGGGRVQWAGVAAFVVLSITLFAIAAGSYYRQ
ncbi:MAG: hypothetical protein WDA27_13325 [Actinomycetota bacterium]